MCALCNEDHPLFPSDNVRPRIVRIPCHRLDQDGLVIEAEVHVYIVASNDKELDDRITELVRMDHERHNCDSHLHPAQEHPAVFSDVAMDAIGDDLDDWQMIVVTGDDLDDRSTDLFRKVAAIVNPELLPKIDPDSGHVVPVWVSVAHVGDGGFYGAYVVEASSHQEARKLVRNQFLNGRLDLHMHATNMQPSLKAVVRQDQYNRRLSRQECEAILALDQEQFNADTVGGSKPGEANASS